MSNVWLFLFIYKLSSLELGDHSSQKRVAPPGFEPGSTDPKSVMLDHCASPNTQTNLHHGAPIELWRKHSFNHSILQKIETFNAE